MNPIHITSAYPRWPRSVFLEQDAPGPHRIAVRDPETDTELTNIVRVETLFERGTARARVTRMLNDELGRPTIEEVRTYTLHRMTMLVGPEPLFGGDYE